MNIGSIPCPNCKRKGLHHPDHAHAFGYKERDKARCRFCNATFRVDDLQEPQPDKPHRVAWIATFGSRPSLTRVTISNETPKTIQVSKSENILGWNYYGRRTNKDHLPIFDTPEEAVAHLINKGTERIHALEDEIRETMETIATLRELEAELKEKQHEPKTST